MLDKPRDRNPELCENCRQQIVSLLDSRIRRILEVAREEETEEGDDDAVSVAKAECFHLMEIQQAVQGKQTCGVFDDFGPPRTIEGPLFWGGGW